jgi:hypothetical protein
MVRIEVELDDRQAEALAQFLKRVGWSEWRGNAVDDDEAAQMRSACERVRQALADAGHSPR